MDPHFSCASPLDGETHILLEKKFYLKNKLELSLILSFFLREIKIK